MPSEISSQAIRRMRPLFGTFVEVGVCGDDGLAASEAAFAAMQGIHNQLSFQNVDSELSQLNRSGGRAIPVSDLLRRVLRLAGAMSRASGGAFNHTVGGALVLAGRLPDHGGELIPSGTEDDVVIEGRTARLRRPIRVTVDGIAKGYGVDCAVRALRHRGVRAGWVNAGGDIRAFGDLTLPVSRRRSDGTLGSLGGLRNAAIASSVTSHEDMARFPGYIVSSLGQPVAAGMWSVLAHQAWRADALTKVAALTPPDMRSQRVARLGGRLISTAQVH